MLLWKPLAGTQLSLVAPRRWVLPSGHYPGNRHDRRAKPGGALRCCVRLQTRLLPKSPPRTATAEREAGCLDCQGQVPQDFKDATIVHLYKRKGNRQLCDNHRGISLLNIARKIFVRILLNRLNGHLEQGLLPESQCGFRRRRGTTDMIFAARQLQEKCQEMRTHLYNNFVDLTKAFDTVNRDGLWKVMQKFGCPVRFTHMVRPLHDGMMARVTDKWTISEAFAVTNGVKESCIHSPTLLSLMFPAMLMNAPGSTSPTRWTADSTTNGGCASTRVYPQPPSKNVSSLTTASQCNDRRGNAKEHGPLHCRL
ncbi:unnamed protein product [Schistocephalus solidus]|uniref:Reverse transcriptase domain-containing protein n=1 Tax=Schistocephalus solidus TaxID=70667 RepID=A0A183TIV3_SCHSO|nr:unnamed protein product [Schistocephalus solidus]